MENNRTILFRGKVSEDDELGYKKGEWVKGSLFIDDIEGETYIFDCGTNDKVKVDPKTIGQCTGLEDYSNKYEVFEDDIVQDLDDRTLGIVYWDEAEAGFMIEFDDFVVSAKDMNYYQIVGNKWDNPEFFEDYLDAKLYRES
ncbi:YopX family protein [Veillonella sp.]|jgi:hypothetical protein|uniref:YopX family protein n=1 Tax=Veillonella sp. TaxID=1926307 RepID=UPI00206AB96B|nr:YopX family protein [Veillonella sp.]DAT46116.1 MAG TPA: YopX protein [Caudoviricetes sp.]